MEDRGWEQVEHKLLHIIGGSSSTSFANTESWNGTSWTESKDLNTGRNAIMLSRNVQTAAIALVVINPSVKHCRKEWDGTSWTEVTDLNTATFDSGGTGCQTLVH